MFGRPMNVENDQKPFGAILRKSLSQAPKRLQDIRMQYHRYDIQFVFVMGANLLKANTLSRVHQENTGDDQDDRARIKK